MKYTRTFIYLLFFLMCFQSIEKASANSMENGRKKEFLELFDYEVQNRAFALISLQNLSNNEESPVKKEFWDAYVSLERLNQKKYRPYTSKYNIAQEPRFMASFKASLIVMAYNWFPSYTWKSLHKATDQHVRKLEQMASLADAADKDFFAYVVDQEKAQLDAIKLMMNGRERQAIELLSDFVVRQDQSD